MSENPTPNTDESLPQSKPSEIVVIATADLYVPDWNPRKLIREAPLQDLTAFLKNGGDVPKLWVWKGTGQAQASSSYSELAHPNHEPRLGASAQGPYAVISGQRRLLAYKRLGVTELEVEMFDIPLAKAVAKANSANVSEDMHWWERYKGWGESAKLLQGLTQREIADELGTNQSEYNRSKQILEALNPACQGQLDSILIKNPDSFPPASVLFTLTDLNDPAKVPNGGPDLVEKGFNLAIEHKWTIAKAKDLVAWVQAGNPPETFDHKAPKTPKPPKLTIEHITKAIELTRQATLEESRGDTATTHRDALKAFEANLATPHANAPTLDSNSLQPISRTDGLAILGQQIGKAVQGLAGFFKPKEPTGQPKSGTSAAGHHAGHAEFKWTEKLGKWFGKIAWRDILKYVHHLCKSIASYMVPVNHFSGSSHHKNSGTNFSLATIAAMILHWFVYTLCQLTFWWILLVSIPSHFFQGLRPWAELPFRFLAHEIFGVLPGWVIPHLFHDWLVTLAVAAAVIGIITAFKAQPARMAVVAVLICLLWNYGRGWSGIAPLAQSPSSRTLSSAVTQPAPTKPPKEISAKEEIAAADQTIKTTPTQSPSSGTSTSSRSQQSQPVGSTPTPKTDVAGNVLKQVAPDVAGDVARHLLPF